MGIKYLSDDQLKGFGAYKYCSIDTSPLSIYIMHPFWNVLVEFFPKSIAPNVMTFVGFLFTVLNFVLLSWYDFGFYASSEEGATSIPNWFWAVAAINIFLAYTLDGIDGKQARRIKLSGPLGELFDHGLDSYTAVLIPACLYSIFGRSEVSSVTPLRMYYIIWTVLLNFYVSHWEKYNTGVLYLPHAYDAGMWASVALYTITWIWSPSLWKAALPFGLSSGHALEFVMHLSAISNLPMVFYNLYKSYKNKTGKMLSPIEALRPLFSFLTFVGVSMLWAHKSPNNIMETDPRAVFLLTGTIFSNISCRLIVSQMSNSRCESINWMTPVLFICYLISLMIPQLERSLIYLLLIGITFAHCHYGTVVVQQMCTHFNRICFGVGYTTSKKE